MQILRTNYRKNYSRRAMRWWGKNEIGDALRVELCIIVTGRQISPCIVILCYVNEDVFEKDAKWMLTICQSGFSGLCSALRGRIIERKI